MYLVMSLLVIALLSGWVVWNWEKILDEAERHSMYPLDGGDIFGLILLGGVAVIGTGFAWPLALFIGGVRWVKHLTKR